MTERAELAQRLPALVGHDVLEITDPLSGWPALGTLVVEDVTVSISFFVGPVGLSQRGRDDIERRFQNPGTNRPITTTPDRYPLLLGLWEADPLLNVDKPLLVSADPARRLERRTRYSMFVRVDALHAALVSGWEEGTNTAGETIRCMLPALLPLSVAADRSGAAPDSSAMQTAIEGSGLVVASANEMSAAAERARRAGTSLIRDARFARRVVEAYRGRCAMCGLNFDLVQGAHIYPAAAPGSVDEPWNGLALCPNHHVAFDRHLLAVHPDTRVITFSPGVMDQLPRSSALRAFADATFDRLHESANPAARPSSQMFRLRYEYFVGRYEWMSWA